MENKRKTLWNWDTLAGDFRPQQRAGEKPGLDLSRPNISRPMSLPLLKARWSWAGAGGRLKETSNE